VQNSERIKLGVIWGKILCTSNSQRIKKVKNYRLKKTLKTNLSKFPLLMKGTARMSIKRLRDRNASI
jgi:hypothetical protein